MGRAAAAMALLGVAARHIDIAGNEAGGEAERAGRLHHQRRKIAAGAAPRRQRLQGALRSPLRAPLIGEALLDRVGQGHQQLGGLGRMALIDEPPDPALEVAGGVGIMPLDRPGEIGHFFRIIGEGIGARSVFEQEVRLVGREVLKSDDVLDSETPGLPEKSAMATQLSKTS